MIMIYVNKDVWKVVKNMGLEIIDLELRVLVLK